MLEKRQMFSGAVLVWNATAAAAAATTADGPLTWDTTTTEWTNQATGDPASWSNASLGGGYEQAVFPAGMDPASILVNGPIDVASIEFESSGIALSGNSLVLPSTGGSIDPLVGWSEIDSSIQGGPLSVGGGGATLILGGSNSYTGGTTAPSTLITAGTLQVGRLGSSNTLGNSTLGASTLGTGTVNLSSGATLAFDLNTPTTFSNNIQLSSGSQTISILGSTTTLSGVISGGGSVLVTNPIGDGGSGTPGDPQPDLVMGGSNTYTGSTTITNNADVSVPGSIASNDVIVDPGSSLSTEPESFDSPTHLQDDGSFDYTDPTPQIDSTDTDVVVSGNGLLTVTGGKLIVQGSNTFSGATNVSYGTLSLQNLNSSGTGTGTVTVMAGSTLDGTGGTQGAVTVDDGGFLTAGTRNGIGMPTVSNLSTGNVTMNSGSTLDATITSASSYDQLNVNGTMNISSGVNLDIGGQLAVAAGMPITLIHTTSGINGSFANVVPNTDSSIPYPTLTVGGQTYLVNSSGGNLTLNLNFSAPALSIHQVSTSTVAGEPTIFQLTATGSGGNRVKGWNINFGDGASLNFNASANTSAGGVYIWEVQHIYADTGTYLVSAATNHVAAYSTGSAPGMGITVSDAPAYVNLVTTSYPDPMIDLNRAIPQSSTQIEVFFVVNSDFDSFEVAAEDLTAGPSDYTVVAAGGSAGVYNGATFNYDSTLVSGLTPGHEYQFLVYGVTASGSLCSVSSTPSVTATTFSSPTLSASYNGSSVTYTATVDGNATSYDLNHNGSLSSLVDFEWRGFNANGSSFNVSSTTTANVSSVTFATTPDYVTFDATAVLLFNSSTGPSGAFDSLTYYNIKPTIVVTGTSAVNNYYVSVNSSTGEYSVTGSVAPIPQFYAPGGINLVVDGRGGDDSLTCGAGTDITMLNNTAADGTNLHLFAGGASLTVYNGSSPAPITPPADLALPSPATAPAYSAIPTAGDTYTPPLAATSSDGAEIIQATATAAPGDVIALTTNADAFRTAGSPVSPGVEAEQTQYWVYGQTTSGNTDWDQATIVSAAPAGTVGGQSIEAVSIQLPYSLPAHSLYFLYEVNQVTGQAATYSQPYVINQPQVWWTDQNNSYVGGKVSVFGTNLTYGVSQQPCSDQSWVYLFPSNSSGGILTGATPIILPVSAIAPDQTTGTGAMDVNAYKLDFDIPEGTPAGGYQVEIYNGHGGIYGLSVASNASGSGSMIHIAAAPVLSSTGSFSLAAAYNSSSNASNTTLTLGDGSISPLAINDAISWASGYQASSGSTYISIQLPPGVINVTDTTDIIQLKPGVHLIGAGDTADALTGTVIEATGGAALQGLVELPAYGSPPPAGENMALTDMYLCANGQVNNNEPSWSGGGVIFSTGNLSGLILQRLTVDATTDQPAQPYPSGDTAPDIWINDGAFNVQLLDSTLIGPGFSGDAKYSSFDNCNFIACAAADAQIGMQAASEVSITRCTDTSLVDNILCPGGNVEYASGARLLESTATGLGLYVGNCTASDLYLTTREDNGLNGGELISVEVAHGDVPDDPGINYCVAVYQNTLAGDGAESFLANGCGVLVQPGYGVIIADNDISNENAGVSSWNAGNLFTAESFEMVSGNSIHNVYVGIGLSVKDDPGIQDTVPFDVGNSYIGNIIACVKAGPGPWATTGSIGISISPDVQDTTPPSITMNIFYDDIVTGANTGFRWSGDAGIPNGPTLLWNCSLFSNGASTSCGIKLDDPSDEPLLTTVSSQGFWS